jgi:hypothetical protein
MTDAGPPAETPRRLRLGIDVLLTWIRKLIQPLDNLIRVLWLTGWCVVLFMVGVVFFLLNDQGLDFLRRLVEARGWSAFLTNLFFFLGVLAWSLSTWYCARLLLARRFPLTDEEFFDRTRRLRTWLPRVGGGLVPLVVAGGLYRVASWDAKGYLAYGLIALYVALGIALFCVLWKRRAMFRVVSADEPDKVMESLPPVSLCVLLASFTLSFGFLVLLLFFPVGLATVVGAPAILLFAAASWILFGSMILSYWPLANRYPSLTAPLILAALIMSWWNDNHTVRGTEVRTAAAPREMPQQHFRGWLEARLDRAPADRPYPVFVVAAAGGGIRAAYWTASVLGRIADESGGTWPDHLYAMSGVSGGSVGSALHAVQIAEFRAAPQTPARKGPDAYVRAVRSTLDNDILSPVLAYLLFPDLVQRFLPVPFDFADRARAIELAMESAVADPQGASSSRFAHRFVELWPEGSARYDVPVLLLNATIVETGQRGIVSNLNIGEDAFPDSVDLLDVFLRTQDMPLSTAAHLSARFTYISPAGTLRASGGDVWMHVVDGGYFENSGTATAVDLMQQMREVADAVQKEKSRRVALMLILVRNDPVAPNICERDLDTPPPPGPQNYLSDLLSPVRALLSTRVARSRLAEETALDLVRGFHGGRDNVQSPRCEEGCVFEFSLGGGGIEPPLGWSLSARGREEMDNHLARQRIKFECIRGLLTGAGCPKEPRCPARRG